MTIVYIPNDLESQNPAKHRAKMVKMVDLIASEENIL